MEVRGGSSGIDADRAAVYSVEDAWSHALERGGRVDFHGSTIELPAQRVLGSLGAMQALADTWMSSAPIRRDYPGAGAVVVRARRGQSRAHYESGGVIAIPLDQPWACREAVLVHEVAHHCSRDQCLTAHDGHFRLAMVRLAEVAFGPEAALLLRASYDGAGLVVPHAA
jgi:putative metallohydrolase (TIGR04338 family)